MSKQSLISKQLPKKGDPLQKMLDKIFNDFSNDVDKEKMKKMHNTYFAVRKVSLERDQIKPANQQEIIDKNIEMLQAGIKKRYERSLEKQKE